MRNTAATVGVTSVRVELPAHLRDLAKCGAEVQVKVRGVVSVAALLDELEARYPALLGTIREHKTKKRRAYMRFYACGEDISHDSAQAPLAADVVSGVEPLIILGAIAGG
jgi:molybdopterin converting factor small subunit